MSTIKRICVYCGSGPGSDPAFVAAARTFGTILAENGIGLVYGGGSVGLMGEIASAMLEHGGEVIGIIPAFLENREHANPRGDLIVTRDMHERKQRMFDEADAFVALPGGVGTLEEVVEQMTWAQLGRHKKPILLANIKKFWDPLCVLLDHMEELQFIRPGLAVNYLVAERVEDILPMLMKAVQSVTEAEKGDEAAGGRAGVSRSTRARRERHRLDLIALGIAHERRVIAGAVFRPRPWRAVGCAAARHRRGMKRLHRLDARCAEANVGAAVRIGRGHGAALVQPEIRIFLAEADGGRAAHQLAVPDRRQHRFVEPSAGVKVAHGDGDMVDHG